MNVYILLDRSGSMNMDGLFMEAIGSINGYVSKLDGDTNVHLSVFDDVSHDTIRETRARDWNNIKAEEVRPRGSTPLYDSTAKIMALAEADGAEKTVLVIMTDGFENASREVVQYQIKERMAAWEKKHWEVVFLGANFDRVTASGAAVGTRYSSTVNYRRGMMDTGMNMLASKTALYSCAVAGAAPINFTEQERGVLNGEEVELSNLVDASTSGPITVTRTADSDEAARLGRKSGLRLRKTFAPDGGFAN